MSNASVSIKFRAGLTPSDPEQQPVLIVGQAAHLGALNWDDVRCKLEPRVTEEAWRRGLQCVTSSPGDSCELWPRAVSLASLPARRSRHAAPARNHALAKIVRSTQRSTDETIVLVCRKRDVLASAVSIARCYPQFQARSAAAPLSAAPPAPAARAVAVEIHLLKEDKPDGESEDEGIGPLDPALCENTLSAEEVKSLLQEAFKVAKELDILEPTVIRGEELKARGMGGIYGVGRAAACPPALVTLSYMAPGAADSVAWVGKGIVYDTGGLSIKARSLHCPPADTEQELINTKLPITKIISIPKHPHTKHKKAAAK
ncbi:hypothetical protein HF086_008489 [Spodoptera exigua]|uniref:Cytosol aminopeptidase domain-containing protein n=1 Tax=Spodoptera exigua TaxID=7107 RepID=A0A922MA59_SPOEX|nr:hypothetical protein HF086_008489 [Spodoptera exigua]